MKVKKTALAGRSKRYAAASLQDQGKCRFVAAAEKEQT
jgi:hypothetical protein